MKGRKRRGGGLGLASKFEEDHKAAAHKVYKTGKKAVDTGLADKAYSYIMY